MKAAATQSMLEFRAENLAVVHLTRRPDLIVSRPDREYGLDLLVTVAPRDKPSGRLFGVQVKGVMSEQNLRRTADGIMSTDNGNAAGLISEAPFPVCQFVFTMSDDQGYYRWINEPVCDRANGATLHLQDRTSLMPLTDAAIDEIVAAVNEWYDARSRDRSAA